MSLSDILSMRMNRAKPKHLVTVVIGTAPALWKGDATLIELPAGSQPRLMDWRPVVGLWTVFYMLTPDWTVMDAAIDCADTAGAKLFGFVHKGIAHTLCAFDKPGEEQRAKYLMKTEWESICS